MRYFDHAASTPLLETIINVWPDLSRNFFANPASPHALGKKSQEILNQSRSIISNLIGASPGTVYFTSGATESANLLIQGYASFLDQISSEKNEIIISTIEHAAVLAPTLSLQKKGWKTHFATVDENGVICPDALLDMINEKTAIVCLIAVNNETGSVQDINRLSKLVKEKNEGVMVITDASQALGKTSQTFDLETVDAFFLSGHKIGAPKGVGFFYLNPQFRIAPLVFGGGQESGYRSGTTDVVGTRLIALAFQEKCARLKDNYDYVKELECHFLANLSDNKVDYKSLIDSKNRSPYILSLIFPFIRSAHLIEVLSERGYQVSGKSACSSSCSVKSSILSALGKDQSSANSIIRISFGPENTLQDVTDLGREIVAIYQHFTQPNESTTLKQELLCS